MSNEKDNKTEEVKKQEVTSEEFFEEKAKQAEETGEETVLDLSATVKVEFLKDIGFMKKGMKQEISQTAYDIYNNGKDKIVKEIR